MPDTATPPVIWAELPEPFDPRWSRLPGLDIEGRALSIEPSTHFYRYERPAWLLCDWAAVRDELLPVTETADQALEQIALDYIREHGRATADPSEVLATAWHVYSRIFRDELLPVAGLDRSGSG